ncbi:MAG: metallophosphoesterase [Acidobacteria bacterium]|nr:metallophosphoesterase [Acidobacteriota bacterium]
MSRYTNWGGFFRISALGLAALAACGGVPAQTTPAIQPAKPAPNAQESSQTTEDKVFILMGAGDIAGCGSALGGAEATAKLIEQIPGEVFASGDLAYEHGNAAEFHECYGATWGRFKDRTHPSLGNHEYGTPEARDYFRYWGDRAGPVGKGYYSFDLGVWHIIALNSNCGAPGLGGCEAGSPEETWLRKDLSEHAGSCIIAFGHHALFSSGILRKHAVHGELRQMVRDLYDAHADLLLVGHEHSYERFAPQDPDGKIDPKYGIREIVVGTGGRSHDPLGFATDNSEVRNMDTFGVIKITLMPHAYTWEFVPVEGSTFTDSGSGVCHNRAPQEARAESRR